MTCWSRALVLAIGVVTSGAPPVALALDIGFACLRPPETRDLLQSHPYIRPFRAMIEAARSAQGEPIGIRMCRYNGQVVYMVVLLKRDGQLLRYLVDAEKGQPLDPQPPLPPPGRGPRSLLGLIPLFPQAPPQP